MAVAFLGIRLLDGFENTAENYRGELPAIFEEAGLEGAAVVVVDQLREDAAVGAINGEARPLRVAADPGAHATAPAKPLLRLGQNGHQALFPTLRATCSPA